MRLLDRFAGAVIVGGAAAAFIAFVNRPVKVPFWIRYEGKVLEGHTLRDRSDVRRERKVEGKHWPTPPDEHTEWMPYG